ncbi:MAG: cellulose binding domain-containing protein, partial [Lachnospiraceae bacterium]|nr:cellulose binding domain-containing protein [Lachnospiraceae bacterium]
MKKIHKRGMKRLGRQMLSLMLVAALVLGLIPESAYAAGTGGKSADGMVYTSRDCEITYKETNSWGNYVNVDVTIQNNGADTINPWKLLLQYDGTISNIWNADIDSSGQGEYIIAAKSYNAKLEAGKSVTFGFTAYGEESKPDIPLGISMEGTATEVSTEEKTTEQKTDGQETGSHTLPEKWRGLNYALFTSGDETLSFYTNETNIYGDVHSNKGFYYQGTSVKVDGTLEAAGIIDLKTASGKDCQQIGKQQEKAESLDMPDITNEVYAYCKEKGTIYDKTTDFNSDSIVMEKPVVVEGSAGFNATTFLGKGILYAKDSVTYNVGTLVTPEDSRVFIVAENGNITLNGSDITLNAVLYAPNGCVNINANHVTLNGRIIAKQVRINGTLININAGPYDFDMLDFLFKPEIELHFGGKKKENRKVTIDVEETLNTEYIIKEDTVWSITKDGSEVKDAYAVDKEASGACHKEMIFRKAGTYQVSVTVTTGKVDYTVTKELIIEKDLEPVAAFDLEQGYYSRDEKGQAKIIVKDASSSPDGDAIGQRIWTVYYDEDNNGEFTEQEASVYSDENETELVIDTDKVGRYKVVLTVVETFTDTIPKLITEDAYLKDDTAEYPAESCVFEVGNEAPKARLSVEKSKSADIVFTLGDTDKNTMDTYNAKAEALKKILKEKGVDAKIDAVSTSTLTAQDTFAWKEYDHYNYSDRWLPALEKHILYEGDDIKMMGYSEAAIKDFLYVPDDNPGQKTFEFDLQRDYNNWHSMEGGGFLFNTTVNKEENIMKGFCILVTASGLKLVQIKCKDLKQFCDGGYDWVQYAGRIMRTFPMRNLYDLHHFKIIVDEKSVSVWDGDTLIIDNFVLPDNDYGYGFGPITSHGRHSCEQQSYFTFKNITMQTMTGSSLSDIVAGYEWRPGASH